jgi:hypothetical protein
MTKLNLKSVLKKEDTVAVLQSFIAVLKSDVCITDDSGKILFGNAEFKEEK